MAEGIHARSTARHQSNARRAEVTLGACAESSVDLQASHARRTLDHPVAREHSQMITLLSLLSLGLAAAVAQGPSDTVVVRGIVFDSIATRPIAGASVQLVRVDSGHANDRFAASTDSTGAFTIHGVPTGRYLAGFYHPALDSLAFELPDHVVDVASGAKPIRLATPSPKTVIRTFCGAQPSDASLLFGYVRDAHAESAIENADVTVTWAAAERTANGLGILDREGRTTTRHAGLFALCGLPVDAALLVHVAHATDSLVIGARIPPSGLLHVTLALGTSGTTGRIVGHVFDRAKQPVVTARVDAANREVTVSDAGAFLFDSVQTGSQTLNVRAIGYAPASMVVNVAEGAATSIEVALERVVTLPGMVSRDSVASAHAAQFLADKRSVGVNARFVDQIRLPGYKAATMVCQLVSVASGSNYCATSGPGYHYCPTTVINGKWTTLTMSDIDPDDVIGIEYFARPPSKYDGEFRMRPRACPFIVWTRCGGVGIPTCGDNPASKPIDKPTLDD